MIDKQQIKEIVLLATIKKLRSDFTDLKEIVAGKPEIKGEKGDSPTTNELISIIKPLIPEPIKGEKGEKGGKGSDGKDADPIKTAELAYQIAQGIVQDTLDSITPTISSLESKIPKLDDFLAEVPETTGERIVEEVNELEIKPELQIDASHIKNLPRGSIGGGLSRWVADSLYQPIGGSANVTTTAITYTALSTDEIILVNALAGAITINLPTTVGNTGKKYFIKKVDSSVNTVTIQPSGLQTIDGDLTKVIQFTNSSMAIVSNGSNWFII